jgi:hypothetical protein
VPRLLEASGLRLRITGCDECVITSLTGVEDVCDYTHSYLFACGQTPALVLVERYLHTGTFNPPAPAEPSAPSAPDQFEALT